MPTSRFEVTWSSTLMLQRGVHIAEEDDVRLLVGIGQHGLEVLEDVQLGEERLAAVEVVAVLATPAEGLAVGALDSLQVDAPAREELHVLLAEVFTDDGDEVYVGEVRGGEREVGQRAADDVFNRRRKAS